MTGGAFLFSIFHWSFSICHLPEIYLFDVGLTHCAINNRWKMENSILATFRLLASLRLTEPLFKITEACIPRFALIASEAGQVLGRHHRADWKQPTARTQRINT